MRDQRVEQWLTKERVRFEYVPQVALADIVDADKSLLNVRLTGQLTDDNVQALALASEQGFELPAFILYRDKGKDGGTVYRIINGHHRKAALELRDLTHGDAYVVDTTDPVVIDRLRRTANLLETQVGVNNQERIIHALHFVARGYSIVDAAHMAKVSHSRVQDAVTVNKVERELIVLGRSRGNKSAAMMKALTGISGPILAEFEALITSAGLTAEVANEYGTQLRSAPDFEACMEKIAEWRTYHVPDVEQRADGIRSPGSTIRRWPAAMGKAQRILAQSMTSGSYRALSGSEIKAQIDLCDKTIEQLKEWRKTLEGLYDDVR